MSHWTKHGSLFDAAQMVAAFAMFPSLEPPERVRRHYVRRVPYHRDGVDSVLMDWELPKSKRAMRRARGRSTKVHIHKHGGEE